MLLPALYLRGISTGDFQDGLMALLGKDAPNSPGVIVRLKSEWRKITAAGESAICRRGAIFMWGPTAFICKRGWSRRPNACSL